MECAAYHHTIRTECYAVCININKLRSNYSNAYARVMHVAHTWTWTSSPINNSRDQFGAEESGGETYHIDDLKWAIAFVRHFYDYDCDFNCNCNHICTQIWTLKQKIVICHFFRWKFVYLLCELSLFLSRILFIMENLRSHSKSFLWNIPFCCYEIVREKGNRTFCTLFSRLTAWEFPHRSNWTGKSY